MQRRCSPSSISEIGTSQVPERPASPELAWERTQIAFILRAPRTPPKVTANRPRSSTPARAQVDPDRSRINPDRHQIESTRRLTPDGPKVRQFGVELVGFWAGFDQFLAGCGGLWEGFDQFRCLGAAGLGLGLDHSFGPMSGLSCDPATCLPPHRQADVEPKPPLCAHPARTRGRFGVSTWGRCVSRYVWPIPGPDISGVPRSIRGRLAYILWVDPCSFQGRFGVSMWGPAACSLYLCDRDLGSASIWGGVICGRP